MLPIETFFLDKAVDQFVSKLHPLLTGLGHSLITHTKEQQSSDLHLQPGKQGFISFLFKEIELSIAVPCEQLWPFHGKGSRLSMQQEASTSSCTVLTSHCR